MIKIQFELSDGRLTSNIMFKVQLQSKSIMKSTAIGNNKNMTIFQLFASGGARREYK